MTSLSSQPAATPPGTPAVSGAIGPEQDAGTTHDSGHGHGGHGHGHGAHADHTITGFVIFLASESLIFLALFVGYAVFKSSAPLWLPAGVEGLEVREPLINTVVLVSSSLVIWLAERALHRQRLGEFRAWWLLTMAMGTYFVIGQAIEWQHLPFGLASGVFGASFYLLTGFHGLHVVTGLALMAFFLVRSLRPGLVLPEGKGVMAVSLFWHFVDVIWVVLFVLTYVWQRR
ncbi:MAG: heme-copper oxidase subunit III [Cyanobacteriota bacterium]